METQLNARLRADAGVAAICGSRVYWNARPEGSALPALVLLLVNQDRSQHMQGFDGLKRSLVQMTAFSDDQAEAVALREAALAVAVEPAIEGGVEFQRGVDVTVRGRMNNINSGVIHQEIVEITLHHS